METVVGAGLVMVGVVIGSRTRRIERLQQGRKYLNCEELGLLCPVCMEEQCLPKLLSCGHSLCTECVLRLTTSQCPVCRARVSTYPDQLPLNYSLMSCIETTLAVTSPVRMEVYRRREDDAKQELAKLRSQRFVRRVRHRPIKWLRWSLLVAAEVGGFLLSVRDAIEHGGDGDTQPQHLPPPPKVAPEEDGDSDDDLQAEEELQEEEEGCGDAE